VGGRAKTPLAAYVATRLREMGERPAILSRGYGRRAAVDGVVVVRDPDGIRADLDRSGDEPLMLARQLDKIAVLVSADRYLAGRLAELHFDCTVHVLDDGFQHFRLRRDIDIVAVAADDLARPMTLPSGRLREPIDAIAAADATIALDDANRAGLAILAGKERPAWKAHRRQQPIRLADSSASDLMPPPGPVVAVAGIAEPSRFYSDLRAAGWTIARELPYPDHHRYSRADVTAIADAVRSAGARSVITTEKDFVRLLPFRPFPVTIGYAPLAIEIERPESFDAWLRERMAATRSAS
jgi:tetraacyldisaccharide 4'-kinase